MPPVFVIGSGIAGLRFSLYMAETHEVVLITKKATVESNTNYAQGGIAVALGDDDSTSLHAADTLKTGGGLSRPEIVQLVVEEGPTLVQELSHMGARFACNSAGELALGREGGHSRNRVVHAADHTGAEIERVLVETVERHPRIRIFPFHFAMDLIVRENEVRGVMLLEPDGQIRVLPAAAVCLATGGLGRVFRYTTNPEIATGDGVAMGWRAGAELRDLEFIQFHPTALARPGNHAFLISEAVRGEGARLFNQRGERFMEKYAPEQMELAPRDVVARAIDAELKASDDSFVLLDVTHLGRAKLKERFPTIFARCQEEGLDISRDPIPVVPAAHYSCGGLVTDEFARTSIDRLFAVGETASHGLHGANRLASNSLLEALVFARRGAQAAVRRLAAPAAEIAEGAWRPEERPICGLVDLYAERLRLTMSQHVGIVRQPEALVRAGVEVAAVLTGVRRLLRRHALTRELIELANLTQCADLIIRSAMARKESRGLHYLENTPTAQGEAAHTLLRNPAPQPLWEPPGA